MRFVDLFAGLGGFHLAARELGGECVLACEIDDGLRKVYEANFGFRPEGDIRAISPRDVPSHHLLCAGFPCQPFSKAGGQMGWRDRIRGTVFDNIAKILEECRPKYVILENVAHFVNHDDGNTYAKVCEALEELGYSIDCRTLSPHQFGVPQIRNRMYLVGRRKGLDGFTWPEPTVSSTEDLSLSDVLDSKPVDAKPISTQVGQCLEAWQEFLETIPATDPLPSFPIWSMEYRASYPFDKGSLHDMPLSTLRKYKGIFGHSMKHRFRRDILANVPSYARRDEAFPKWKQDFVRDNRAFLTKHGRRIVSWTERARAFPPSHQKFEWNCQGENRTVWDKVIQFRASGVRVKRPTTSPSLVAMTTTQVPIIGWERRYMTIHECARLQSMDELEHLPSGGSAMKALGNAVNVTVARSILERLLLSK